MNPDPAQFCAGCGAELARQCNACGKGVPADARFCPYCGEVIVSEPPVPWLERRFSAEVRHALFSLARGLGITLLVLAFVTAFLTPPPRIIDETLLLVAGASMMVIAEVLKSGRKPKPPGGSAPALPDPMPPDGIMLPYDEDLAEEESASPEQVTLPPGSTHGPYLN